MSEPKPTNHGKDVGEVSPNGEWVWLGADIGWKPTDEPQADASLPLDL